MFMGLLRMIIMVDARMVKARQAWQVLQGKLISLGWQNRITRIEFFENLLEMCYCLAVVFGG